ncbi:hypothetical protein SAMN04488124_1881 [Halogeometricum limi]|uniref:Uncharacterized protein n=1 Tax=Halogeometricum limi TaxID=555875 RepID=A0A1I6H7S8_9EURY|nr:hypothetical protein SAMN04488124_1881 [Halogeometricum limi]
MGQNSRECARSFTHAEFPDTVVTGGETGRRSVVHSPTVLFVGSESPQSSAVPDALCGSSSASANGYHDCFASSMYGSS